WQVIGGEPLAGSAYAGDHLVEADQETVLLPALREPLPEELWGRVGGQSGGADRLAEERGHVLRPHLLERPVERIECLLPRGIEAPGARRDVRLLEQVWRERTLEAGPPGERERGHRRAVVGLSRRDHPPAAGLTALHVIAAGKAQGGLVRLRAAGDEVHSREALRRHRHELAGELLLRRVGEPLVVDEGELARLLGGGRRDVPPPMSKRRGHR